MLAPQVDAVLDQAVLLKAGKGWAGAGALALNLLAAATVIVVGPLGAQALAGRLDISQWRDIAPITVGITTAYLIAVPLALPFLTRGGAVAGVGYHRIFVFAMPASLSPFPSTGTLGVGRPREILQGGAPCRRGPLVILQFT